MNRRLRKRITRLGRDFPSLYRWCFRAKYHLFFLFQRARGSLRGGLLSSLRHKTILIVGPARSGKSRLSRRLQRMTGLPVVELDDFRKQYRDAETYEAWSEARLLHLERLSRQRGIIIEGDEVIIDNLHAPSEDRNVRFDLIERMFNRPDVVLIFVGCSGMSADDRAAALLRDRRKYACWTVAQYRDAEVPRLAESLVRLSREIRGYCTRAGHEYLEVADASDREIDSISQRVLKRLMKPGQDGMGDSDRVERPRVPGGSLFG